MKISMISRLSLLIVVLLLLAGCNSSTPASAPISSSESNSLQRKEMGTFVRDTKGHLGKNEEHIYTYTVKYGHGDVYGSYRFVVTTPLKSWNPVVTLLVDGKEIVTNDVIDRIAENNVDVIRIPEGAFLCTNRPTQFEIVIRGRTRRDAGDYTISFVPLQASTKDLRRCMTLDH